MYSDEQLAVIKSTLKEISVESPPGSGKTHCILGVVKEHKEDHHLILAFNSAIKSSIKNKIAENSITNAEVFTFHGLAFDYFKDSDQIIEFINREMVNLDFFTLEQMLKILKIDIKKTNRILTSLQIFFRGDSTFKRCFEHEADEIVKDIKEVLNYVRVDKKAPMFHEYYIKMFQLISYSNSKYDTILVDESQDKTTCYDAIIKNLKSKRIIHFGDNQQKIYAYNGAVGMEKSEFRLTKSFRIGKEHSDVCNALVNDILKSSETDFEGVNPNGKLVDKLSNVDRVTVICRTNKEVVRRAIEEIKRNKIVCILGGLPINTDLTKNIFTASPDNPKYYKGKKIVSYDCARKLYSLSKSQEIKTALEFINQHGDKTMEIINTIKMKTIKEAHLADICIITAHKSKGLEFGCVELADDFPTIDAIKEKKNLAELYTLYVALSRSTGKMKLNKNIEVWYKKYKEGRVVDPIICCKKIEDLF
ncbi:MAG: UvrD-helicase domain-containing protein [Cetobacterium sp.]